MKRKLAGWVIWYMVTVMVLFGITPKVDAGFSPSEVIGQSQMNKSIDVDKIRKFIEMKMVRERLNALGFSPEEIQARLSQLPDEQIHQVALKIDEMKVGGDAGEAVIIVLLILILVGLIIYFTGHKIIVK
jgi:hypothetical protein